MAKGLIRSLERVPPRHQGIWRSRGGFDATLGFTQARNWDSINLPDADIDGPWVFLGGILYMEGRRVSRASELDDRWSGSFGLGRVAVSGNSMSGLEEEYIPEQAIPAAVGGRISRLRAFSSNSGYLRRIQGALTVNILLNSVVVFGDNAAIRFTGSYDFAFLAFEGGL